MALNCFFCFPVYIYIFGVFFFKKVEWLTTPWRLAKFAPNLWKLSSYLAIDPHSRNCLDHQNLASASHTLFYRFISEGGLWWHVSWSRWPPSSVYRQGWLGNRSFREISWEKFLGTENYPPKNCEVGDIIFRYKHWWVTRILDGCRIPSRWKQAGIERLKVVNGCHQKIWITHLANDHHLVLQKENYEVEVGF